MKYASSIRYGGQLIEAVDCDYNSYKDLGLLCPECKDPVFLRADTTQVRSGKDVLISAHFAHFPGKDPALVLACESRVKQYDARELEKRVAASKGQRLELLKKHFVCILRSSSLFQEGLDKAKMYGWFDNDVWFTTKSSKTPWRNKWWQEKTKAYKDFVSQNLLIHPIQKEVEDYFEVLEEEKQPYLLKNGKLLTESQLEQGYFARKKVLIEIKAEALSDETFAELIDDLALSLAINKQRLSELKMLSKTNVLMHKMITTEIILFLSRNKMRDTLSQLLFSCTALSESVFEHPEWMRERYQGITDRATYWYLCQIIAQIPWQIEFEKRSQPQVQSKRVIAS